MFASSNIYNSMGIYEFQVLPRLWASSNCRVEDDGGVNCRVEGKMIILLFTERRRRKGGEMILIILHFE